MIPAYNSGRTLKKCLASLLQQKFEENYEIIVVDDHSKDDTCKIVKDFGANLIKLKEHTGRIGLLRNIGVLNAKADNIIFVDSDCIATKNFLAELYHLLGKEKCVMGYTIDVPTNWLSLPFVKATKSYYDLSVNRGVVRYLAVPWGIKRSIFLKTGGFNMYLKGSEDKEYGIRLRKKDITIRHTSNARIYHIHFLTIRCHFLKKYYRGMAHRLAYKTSLLATFIKIVKRTIKTIFAILTNRKEQAIDSVQSIIGNLGFLSGQVHGALSSVVLDDYTLDKSKKTP